ALQNFHARMHRFFVELPFPRPSAAEVTETVAIPARHVKRSRLRILHDERLPSSIFNHSFAANDARLRKDRVAKVNEQIPLDVLQRNGQRVAVSVVLDIAQNKAEIAV